MKDDVVQFVFAVIAVVAAAGAEDILPAFFGFGFPLLLALVMLMSPRANVLPGVMVAVAAGAFEDALSALPPMTSICFFVVAALVSHKKYFPRPFLIVLFPAYALWAGLCMQGPMGDLFARVLVSVPVGALSMAGMFLALEWTCRKAGIDG